MHLDTTINIGNLIVAGSFLLAAVFAWRDMSWRVKNLETWRTEHMVDADARDKLISNMSRILDHVRWQTERMGGSANDVEVGR